mgnify:CR=1 FL=1
MTLFIKICLFRVGLRAVDANDHTNALAALEARVSGEKATRIAEYERVWPSTHQQLGAERQARALVEAEFSSEQIGLADDLYGATTAPSRVVGSGPNAHTGSIPSPHPTAPPSSRV